MADLKINIVLVIFIGVLISKGVCYLNDDERLNAFLEDSKIEWRNFCNKSQFDIEFNTKQNNLYNELHRCIVNDHHSKILAIKMNSKINNKEEINCEILNSLLKCLNNFTSVDFCNDGKKPKTFELFGKVEAIICKDKGKAFTNILEQIPCLLDTAQLQECFFSEAMLLLKLGRISNYFYPTHDYFDPNDCRQFEKLETCVIEKVNQCSNDTSLYSPINTFKELFTTIENITNCEYQDFYDVFKI